VFSDVEHYQNYTEHSLTTLANCAKNGDFGKDTPGPRIFTEIPTLEAVVPGDGQGRSSLNQCTRLCRIFQMYALGSMITMTSVDFAELFTEPTEDLNRQ
jgi:hypothetical protein